MSGLISGFSCTNWSCVQTLGRSSIDPKIILFQSHFGFYSAGENRGSSMQLSSFPVSKIVFFFSTGSISENENPAIHLLGIHWNGIQHEASTPHLYHRGNRRLSAHHHLLVNVSLGQVTARSDFKNLKSERVYHWLFVHLPLRCFVCKLQTFVDGVLLTEMRRACEAKRLSSNVDNCFIFQSLTRHKGSQWLVSTSDLNQISLRIVSLDMFFSV